MFPRWAEILGLGDAQLVGLDLPINGPLDVYRQPIAQIKAEPLLRGALITTHKINTLRAARDLFDELTPDAQITGEVSSVYKRDGKLIGHATDPELSARSMDTFIPPGHWRETRADVLCLGAGGAAAALVTAFVTRHDADDLPRHFVVVNRSQMRLDSLRAMVENKLPPTSITFEYVLNEIPAVNDQLMTELAPGSLVVNATGMGKDIPGSPITDNGRFPLGGFAWDLNYRGELDFLRQARAGAMERELTIEDGWTYFVIGWAEIIGQVFDVAIMPSQFEQLAEAAAAIR